MAVKERRLDAAFVAEPPHDPALSHLPLFREKLMIIASRDHRRIRSPSDVKGDTIVAFPNGCAYRRALGRWLGGKGFAALRSLELGSYHAIVACVAAGTGIALVPESVLDVVNAAQVARYRLPKLHGDIVTPLIWRSAEATPCVVALRELFARNAPRGRQE